MSHRRRRLLHITTSTSWLIAAAVLLLRDPGALRLSETLILMVAFVLTLSSTISATLAPVVAQNVLLARLVREDCHCSENLRLVAGQSAAGAARVIPLRPLRRSQRTDRV